VEAVERIGNAAADRSPGVVDEEIADEQLAYVARL